MSVRRRAALPPELPGFTFVEPVGSGGFADVHLFEQHMPRRRVAVKVLHVDRMSDGSLSDFTTEANLMALLSNHPSIVTIYGAGIAPDGRPYLVMEYAPRPTMQARVKQGPLSVPEVLRIGVQVSAAVETAHRAGVMHRDIKPANILVTEYGRPALTDFGIASTSSTDLARGLSIPWSAPEMFAEVPFGGPAADTFSLAATVFTLLSGHAPYQHGERLNSVELIHRIRTAPVPELQRQDVPASLRLALRTAMAKNPASRPESALAFARMLQKVEIELGLSVTPIDIIDDNQRRDLVDGEIDGLTRVRGVMDIIPREQEASALAVLDEGTVTAARHPVSVPPTRAARRAASPSVGLPTEPVDIVAPRDRAPGVGGQRRAQANRQSRRLVIGGVVSAAVAVGAIVAASVLTVPHVTAGNDQPTTPQDITVTLVPTPDDLVGKIEGDNAVFTWSNPRPEDGDSYVWRTFIVGQEPGVPQRVQESTVTVPLGDAASLCISVSIRRENGSGSSPAQACAG